MTTLTERVLAASEWHFNAVLSCALGENRRSRMVFSGKATIRANGVVHCDYTSNTGRFYADAPICAVRELEHVIITLSRELNLDITEHDALVRTVAAWIGKDERETPGLNV